MSEDRGADYWAAQIEKDRGGFRSWIASLANENASLRTRNKELEASEAALRKRVEDGREACKSLICVISHSPIGKDWKKNNPTAYNQVRDFVAQEDFFGNSSRPDPIIDAESLQKRVNELERQLPEGMKDCTIEVKECALGHGWLTATNWVQHGCPTCRAESAEKERDELKAQFTESKRLAEKAGDMMRAAEKRLASLTAPTGDKELDEALAWNHPDHNEMECAKLDKMRVVLAAAMLSLRGKLDEAVKALEGYGKADCWCHLLDDGRCQRCHSIDTVARIRGGR